SRRALDGAAANDLVAAVEHQCLAGCRRAHWLRKLDHRSLALKGRERGGHVLAVVADARVQQLARGWWTDDPVRRGDRHTTAVERPLAADHDHVPLGIDLGNELLRETRDRDAPPLAHGVALDPGVRP